MLQILPALPRAPLVAGLVLGRNQRVGAAALFGREIKITARMAHALKRIPAAARPTTTFLAISRVSVSGLFRKTV
jgi:hypothetical protein